jgi:hypothetical protein
MTRATRAMRWLAAAAVPAALALGAWTARAPEADEVAVRAALNGYFAGQSSGDGSHYRRIFLPSANLYSVRDGKLAELPSAEWIGRATGKPPADDAQRKRRIEYVHIAGDAAAATLVTDYPGGRTTDYMTLLKVDGEWKIASKTWARQTPAP